MVIAITRHWRLAPCLTPPADAARGDAPRDVEDVRRHLRRGAEVSAPDAAGRAPVHYAAISGSSEVLAELLAAGADVNARTAGRPRCTGRRCSAMPSDAPIYWWRSRCRYRRSARSDTLHWAVTYGHPEMLPTC